MKLAHLRAEFPSKKQKLVFLSICQKEDHEQSDNKVCHVDHLLYMPPSHDRTLSLGDPTPVTEIFEVTCARVADAALDGRSCAVMVWGPNASGKSELVWSGHDSLVLAAAKHFLDHGRGPITLRAHTNREQHRYGSSRKQHPRAASPVLQLRHKPHHPFVPTATAISANDEEAVAAALRRAGKGISSSGVASFRWWW